MYWLVAHQPSCEDIPTIDIRKPELSFTAEVVRYSSDGRDIESRHANLDKIRDYCYIAYLPSGKIDVYMPVAGVLMAVYYSVSPRFLSAGILRALGQLYRNKDSIRYEYERRISEWRDGDDTVSFGLHEIYLCDRMGLKIPSGINKLDYKGFILSRGIPLRPVEEIKFPIGVMVS